MDALQTTDIFELDLKTFSFRQLNPFKMPSFRVWEGKFFIWRELVHNFSNLEYIMDYGTEVDNLNNQMLVHHKNDWHAVETMRKYPEMRSCPL